MIKSEKTCLCCNFGTLDSEIFDICEICGWQDDPSCWDDPDSLSGANGGISLKEAQKNYKEIGACNEVMLKFKNEVEKLAKRFKDGASDKKLYELIEKLVVEDGDDEKSYDNLINLNMRNVWDNEKDEIYDLMNVEAIEVDGLEEIKKQIKASKKVLQEKYGVTKIGIFGSYARNEQRENSDIDILIKLEKSIGLLEFLSIKYYLED